MQGPRDSSCGLLLSRAHEQGAGSKTEQLGIGLTPLWDVGFAGGSLTDYAAALAQAFQMNK